MTAGLLVSMPGPLARQRREQIVTLFPALAPIMSEFVDVIDTALPFVDEVARRLRVKKCVVRHMQQAPRHVIEETGSEVCWLVRCLDRTAPDHFPDNEDAWHEFVEAQKAIDEIAELCGRSAAQLSQSSDGGWSDIFAAAAKARDQPFLRLPTPDGLAGQILDFFRVVFSPEVCIELRRRGIELTHSIADQVGIMGRETKMEIVRLLYRQQDALGILRKISDWVANLGNPLSHPGALMRHICAPLCRIEAWPPLFECPVVTPSGLIIVPLSSSTALVEEGRTMHHCIGKYPGRLAYYPFHAVSIRTSDGFRLASAILQTQESKNVTVWDFNGYRNSGIDPRARSALEWLIERISKGSMFVDWAGLAAKREARWAHTGGPDAATDRLQFNFYDQHLREWAWTGFHRMFVGPPYNGLTRDDMMLHTGLRDLAVARAQAIAAMDLTGCPSSPNRLLAPWNERM